MEKINLRLNMMDCISRPEWRTKENINLGLNMMDSSSRPEWRTKEKINLGLNMMDCSSRPEWKNGSTTKNNIPNCRNRPLQILLNDLHLKNKNKNVRKNMNWILQKENYDLLN